jgi:tetratricopeptide (TPR) repeat protein
VNALSTRRAWSTANEMALQSVQSLSARRARISLALLLGGQGLHHGQTARPQPLARDDPAELSKQERVGSISIVRRRRSAMPQRRSDEPRRRLAGGPALGDVFRVQDDLTRRIVETLKVPLSARDRRALDRDVPASPEAYEFYLRANRFAVDPQNWTVARDLYLQSVERDPGYAPAWARLGRIHRVLAKYGFVPETRDELRRAEEAFRRAFELNPDLSLAHSLYTALEVESGHAEASMTRLIERLMVRSDDPDLLTGLVLACRYCGLLEASISAHEEARRLDPSVRSSVAHSFYLLGDYERAIATDVGEPAYVSFMALLHLGREDEARALSEQAIARAYNPHLTKVVQLIRAILTRDPVLGTETARLAEAVGTAFQDPEGFYYWGISLAAVGNKAYALDLLSRAVAGGFAGDQAMVIEPWLDSVRGDPAFIRLLRVAE